MWLLALYVALAEEGVEVSKLMGTTQNDLIKEYLARGTYIYPPGDSMWHLIRHVRILPASDTLLECLEHLFLPFAGSRSDPVQELAFALVAAITILDAIKARNCFTEEEFERCGSNLFLCECGNAFRRRAVQNARI